MSETAEIIPFGNAAAAPPLQRVAPYEAKLIARTEQWRVAVAGRAGPMLHALRSQLNQIDHDLQRRLSDLLRIETQIEAGQLHRFMPPFSRRAYTVLISAMLLLELPVNKAALDFLRLPKLESYALALFFALVNFVAAKCSARVFRQEPFDRPGWRSWAIAAATNLALLVTIFLVGQLRSLESHQASSAMTFFSLQLAFYVATLFLSFQVIAPSREAEQLNRRRDALRTEVNGLWNRRAHIAKTHNEKLEKARLRLIDLEADAQERVAEYRDGNRRARTDAAPSWFRHSIGSNVWRSLDLGHPVDEHPAAMGELIGRACGDGKEE